MANDDREVEFARSVLLALADDLHTTAQQKRERAMEVSKKGKHHHASRLQTEADTYRECATYVAVTIAGTFGDVRAWLTTQERRTITVKR